MAKIMVYPTHENALVIAHPTDGALSDAGSLWENDGYTARMLADRAVTTVKEHGHISKRHKPDASQPPARGTGAHVAPTAPTASATASKPSLTPTTLPPNSLST